ARLALPPRPAEPIPIHQGSRPRILHSWTGHHPAYSLLFPQSECEWRGYGSLNQGCVRERAPDAERMTVDERRKCLKRMRGRYLAATREERGRLLDDLAALTGLHRKSVVRQMKGASLERQPRRRQRGREYGAAVDDALRVI